MAEGRTLFGFRLPWSQAASSKTVARIPSTTPASSMEPSTTSTTPYTPVQTSKMKNSPAQSKNAQRPPFRPARAAPSGAATKSPVSPSPSHSPPTRKPPWIPNSKMQENNQVPPKSPKPSFRSTESQEPLKHLKTKKETKPDAVPEAKISFIDKTMSLLKSSTMSETSRIKELANSNQETKQVKEIVQNSGAGVNSGDQSTLTPRDKSMNIITLAGDNRGASMQLGHDSSRKGDRIHIHRGYPDESADATTHGQERSKAAETMEDQTIGAYVNCNVQGINNSILFNGSIKERNPGVHICMPVQSSEEIGSFKPQKAESSVTSARTIRRRCLRALFLESSDSDQDNPQKPRRHGCRVGCKKMTK